MVAFNDGERAAFILADKQDGSRLRRFLTQLAGHSMQLAAKPFIKAGAGVADALHDFIDVEPSAGELAPLRAREKANTLDVSGLQFGFPPLRVAGQFAP